MAKKYKYSYYVFDTKKDYDLFLELINFHGCTGKYDGYDRNEIYYFVRAKFDPNEINKRKLLGTHIEFWTMPENEEEFKTLLQKVLDNYS